MELNADAMLKEAGMQMGSLAARNVMLAGQLAAALEKIAKLEEELQKKNAE